MGERSQIFINVDYESTKQNYYNEKYLVARYYQWNYGERMISRCRGIIEWIVGNIKYIELNDSKTKLARICDVNWDYHDIVMSVDILKEYIEEDYYKGTYEMFTCQDNNDGILYIDVKTIDMGFDKEPKYSIKYCFVDYDNKYLGSATNYLKWNCGKTWKNSFSKNDQLGYTEDNLKYIRKNAKIMTEEEYKDFINRDYSEYDFAKKKEVSQ